MTQMPYRPPAAPGTFLDYQDGTRGPAATSGYRWWIASPGEDETLRSVVERADRVHGSPLCDTPYPWQESLSSNACDAPTSRELLLLARMMNTPARRLLAHRLADGPHLLQIGERRAFCPQCIYEDHCEGRPRAFRRAWARFFLVSCPVHGVPLQWAEPRLSGIAESTLATTTLPESTRHREILQLIDDFAQTVESCLWQGASWPSKWRGTPHSARAYLARHLCNLIAIPTVLPVSHLWRGDVSFPLVAVPKRPTQPLRGSAWDAVRGVGRPAWRRAALWLTAWRIIPNLPFAWKPEVIPEDYLEATDEWWKSAPDMPHVQKLRRTYLALRRSCLPIIIDEHAN